MTIRIFPLDGMHVDIEPCVYCGQLVEIGFEIVLVEGNNHAHACTDCFAEYSDHYFTAT